LSFRTSVGLGGQCYDFKNIFADKGREKIVVFDSQESDIMQKKLIITLVFEKTANLCQNLAKIAENCDHKIDPRLDLGIGSGVLVIRWGDDDLSFQVLGLLLPATNKRGTVSLIPVEKDDFLKNQSLSLALS
jgi:pantothenate kinase